MSIQYASYSDLIVRYDSRVISQVSNDQNSDTPNMTNINTALQDASVDILSAVLVGQIYSLIDINYIFSQGDATLTRLTCEIAMKYLMQRRVEGSPDDLEKMFSYSDRMLKFLANGEKIFYTTVNGDLTANLPNTVHPNYQTLYRQGSLLVTPFFNRYLNGPVGF